MKKTKGIHDRIINKLEKILQNNNIDYDVIQKNIEYRYGEIDLFAIYKNYILYFEIKSTYSLKSYNKGTSQLKRIKEKYATNKTRNWYFFVHGNKDKNITIRRIK